MNVWYDTLAFHSTVANFCSYMQDKLCQHDISILHAKSMIWHVNIIMLHAEIIYLACIWSMYMYIIILPYIEIYYVKWVLIHWKVGEVQLIVKNNDRKRVNTHLYPFKFVKGGTNTNHSHFFSSDYAYMLKKCKDSIC